MGPGDALDQGEVLLDATGTTPLSGTTDIQVGIYDPSGNCLLYEELQTLGLSATQNGAFSMQVASVSASLRHGITTDSSSSWGVERGTPPPTTGGCSWR